MWHGIAGATFVRVEIPEYQPNVFAYHSCRTIVMVSSRLMVDQSSPMLRMIVMIPRKMQEYQSTTAAVR
jgi:hypothetical protein